ncbi:MAG: DUF3035 domain-containing protein [Aliishimia sp.]
MRLMRVGLALLILATLGACAKTGLRYLPKPGEGPDEFIIVPSKPLEAPTSYSSLPAPTPGGANITDQQPLQDAIVALGGRRNVDTGTVVPSRDAALVNQVSRFGRDGNVRATLAAEDVDFRRRRGRLTRIRLARTDRYNDVYEKQALNADRELKRWRRAGARTPSAPN